MTNDPVVQLREQVQARLRDGGLLFLAENEIRLLCGWYERRLGTLEEENATLAKTVDQAVAGQLEAERARSRNLEALDRATTGHREDGRAGS
jgi:hypothetical protein